MGWAETVATVERARAEQPVVFDGSEGPLSDFRDAHRGQHFRKATTCRRLADPELRKMAGQGQRGHELGEDPAFQSFPRQRVARFALPNTSAGLTRPQRILVSCLPM
jgi:hypothetical protein